MDTAVLPDCVFLLLLCGMELWTITATVFKRVRYVINHTQTYAKITFNRKSNDIFIQPFGSHYTTHITLKLSAV